MTRLHPRLTVLAAVVVAGLTLGACGSGGGNQTSLSGTAEHPPRGFEPGAAPPGATTEGRFVNGSRHFFIVTNEKDGRLFAGSLSVPDACMIGTYQLQPGYGPDGPTSGYIVDNSFSMKGDWNNKARIKYAGSASGRVSADGNSVTVSWPSASNCIGPAGNNVVFTRAD